MQYNVARKHKPMMNQLNSNKALSSSEASSNNLLDGEDLTWFDEFKSMIVLLMSYNETFWRQGKGQSTWHKLNAATPSMVERATGLVIKSLPTFFNWNKYFYLLRFDLKPVSE